MEYQKEEYDVTVSESRAESLQKAVEILEKELYAAQQEKLNVHRPNINIRSILLRQIIFALVFFFIWLLSYFACLYCALPVYLTYLIPIVSFLIYFFLRGKQILTTLILVYQKFAPARIRAACVFSPTCSEYMLISIDKYGAIRGVVKGLNRLMRCHYPNGGEDNP